MHLTPPQASLDFPSAVMVRLFLGLNAVSGTFLLAAPLRTDRQDFDWREAFVCSAERTRRCLLATACAHWAIDLACGQQVMLRHLEHSGFD